MQKWACLGLLLAVFSMSACMSASDQPRTHGKTDSTRTDSYLVPVQSSVQFVSMLTAGDAIDGYKMVGIPDGLGVYANGNDTFTVLMNHEIAPSDGTIRAHGNKGAFVSAWVVEKDTLNVIQGHDVIQSVFAFTDNRWVEQKSTVFSRFCSADLAQSNAFFHSVSGKGTTEKIFLTGEEDAASHAGRGVAVVVTGADTGNLYILPAFGPFTQEAVAWENLVAHPNAGEKTIVIATSDGGSNGVYVYVGTKQNTGNEVEKAGLVNGKLYRVVIHNATNETPADDAGLGIVNGSVAFSLVENTPDLGVPGTSFLRPEDGVWDIVHNSTFYFATTHIMDAHKDGNANPDVQPAQIGRSRIWSLNFTDINNPLAGGVLTMELTGEETVSVADQVHGPQMIDNITMDGTGTLLLQEDPGNNIHNAKIWKFHPQTKKLEILAQFDENLFGDYRTAHTDRITKNEESSGIIDITDILNRADGRRYFLIAVQKHTADTSIDAPQIVSGGQLVLMSYQK